MQKVKSYSEWKSLPKDAQEQEYKSWDVYKGEGQDIILAAIKEMEAMYKKENPGLKISKGIYHGGILVIDIVVKKNSKIRLPRFFNGFPVMKSTDKN